MLDAFAIPDALMYLLVIGALPGTSATVSPALMLAVTSGLIGLILFETAARHFGVVRRIRRFLFGTLSRRERLPARRYTRI